MEEDCVTPPPDIRYRHLQNVKNCSTPLRIPPSPHLSALGYGTCINVYRLDRSPKMGQMRSPWALKCITKRARAEKYGSTFYKRILQEAVILRDLNHKNIIGYRGVVTSPKGFDSLALECMTASLGDILEKRFEKKAGALPAKDCLKMIYDISKGLDYLHTEAMILHCDIKSFNILINGDFEICKLCDFGTSISLDKNGEVKIDADCPNSCIGTELWAAPEVLGEQEVIDTKADIFSFGLTIYETIALVPPHTLELGDEYHCDGVQSETVESSYTIDASIKEVEDTTIDKEDEESEGEAAGGVDNDNASYAEEDISFASPEGLGTRPPLPMQFELTEDYNPILELFYHCTQPLSEDRPTAKTIWQAIDNMKNSETTIDE